MFEAVLCGVLWFLLLASLRCSCQPRSGLSDQPSYLIFPPEVAPQPPSFVSPASPKVIPTYAASLSGAPSGSATTGLLSRHAGGGSTSQAWQSGLLLPLRGIRSTVPGVTRSSSASWQCASETSSTTSGWRCACSRRQHPPLGNCVRPSTLRRTRSARSASTS